MLDLGRNRFLLMLWLLATVAVLLSGCRRGVGRLDAQERSLDLIRKAVATKAEGDIDGAVALYKESLLANPEAARAHLDLALLLHDHKKDFVPAIYHYRRYIELRPDTEKKEMIEDRLRLAMQIFSARSVKGGEDAIMSVTSLEKENAELKSSIERLQAENAKLQKEAVQLRALVKARTQHRPDTPASSPRKPRTYRVRRGDSLLSIASDVYGDSTKWSRIYEANRNVIKDKDHVPVDTVLKIP